MDFACFIYYLIIQYLKCEKCGETEHLVHHIPHPHLLNQDSHKIVI